MSIKNALSIDLEDWYHPEFVRKLISYNPKSQITDSTKKIIDLLEKYKVKATFFILGDIAKKYPHLIKTIYNKGHEIAFHGMSHLPLWELNYQKLNKEFLRFKKIINKRFKYEYHKNLYEEETGKDRIFNRRGKY